MTDIDNNSGLKDATKIPEAQIIGSNSPLEEDDTYKGKVKVINNVTGEVMEREYSSVHDIKSIYLELDGTRKAIDRAQKKLKALLEQFMANYDEYEFSDGSKVRWIHTNRKEFSAAELKKYLDDDVVSLVSSVSSTKLSAYLNECVERGEMTFAEKDEIFATATDTPGTAYIKISD